jgi:hypothetical protein
MAGKTIAISIVCIFLLAPLSVEPCQEAEIPKNTCCCCEDSGQISKPDDTKQHECPCQIEEGQPEENPPTAILSQHKRTPESLSLASEIEKSTQDHITHFAGLYPDHFLLLNKDQPLYLLNSSFLL